MILEKQVTNICMYFFKDSIFANVTQRSIYSEYIILSAQSILNTVIKQLCKLTVLILVSYIYVYIYILHID